MTHPVEKTMRPERPRNPSSGKNKWFRIGPSPIQGRGAFATRAIPGGTRIIEYTGEKISHKTANARYDDERMDRHHTFLFAISRSIVIDAAVGGNDSRLINHSCRPNCEMEIAKDRIYVHARRNIRPGEELTYDYAFERAEADDEETEKLYLCNCGASRCRGSILLPRSR